MVNRPFQKGPAVNYFGSFLLFICLLNINPLKTNGQCLLSGTKSIPGDFPTLTAAVAAVQANGLAGSVILELQPGYTSASETFPITLGNINCASTVNTITIRPAAGASNLSITSTNNSSTIDIINGNYWIVDGRAGGTGNFSSLGVSNTSGGLTSSALRFTNNASNNIIQYVSFTGTAPSLTSGVIVFGTTTTTGNNNNLIEYCNINGSAVAASPGSNVSQNGIYASGTTSAPNNNNVISNCNIFDCYKTQGGATSSGISISTGNSDWTIQSNSFYYTTTKTGTISTATVYGINISNASGNNFQILDNFIGGTAARNSGIMTLTGQTIFKAMNLLVGTTAATSIQGNTISNININSTISPPFEGIAAGNGNYNIGDVNGNIIGSQNGTGNISLTTGTTTTATAESKGININPTVNGVTNISNNKIGSVTVSGSTINVSHGFIAINNKSTSTIISNNVIGSNSSFSINANTLSVSGTVQQLIGIIVNCNTVTVTNNIINHLSNSYVPSSVAAPVVRGIVVTGAGTISNNIVHDLYAAASSTSFGAIASIIGMQQIGNTGGGAVTISGNTIFAFQNSNASAAVGIVGLNYNSSTNTGIVSGNYIHDLLSSSNSANISGIYITTGTASFQNNMIGLGYDTLGNSLIKPCNITGIWELIGTNNFYHNTVYIGGTGVGNSSLNTFAFNSAVTGNTRDIRNNIFINARSNASSGGKHYAVQVGGTSINPAGLTLDYNIYLATGTGGVFGRFNALDAVDLNAWRTAVGKDVFSKSISPCFANPAAGFPNLHLTDCSGAGSPADMSGVLIPSVATDFDGDIRSSFTPTDIGADAGNYNNASTLGTYASASVVAGKNISITPSSPPVNVSSLSVFHSTNFTGIVAADPVTGIVYITDAKPAGTYMITIKSNTNLNQTINLTVTNPACSRGNFPVTTTVNAGNDPVFAAVGDFNRDGNQDFAIVNDSSNSVSINLGNGLGGVAATADFSVGNNPKSAAIGDFNNDGKLDIVVSNSGSNNLSILQGDGLGGFTALASVNVGTSPYYISIGDFNTDGFDDLAASNDGSNTVSIRLGNGNGTFSGSTEIAAGTQPRSIAIGDFNGDAKQDLAVANYYPGSISLRFGNGLGGFTGTSSIALSANVSSIAVGDFNGNGVQDLIATTYSQVAVCNGNGTGGFTTTYYQNTGFSSQSVVVGDVNGDGFHDAVVADFLSNNVITLIGNGSILSAVSTVVDTGSNPSYAAIGDFNNDGIQDVVTTYKSANLFKIRLGAVNGVNVSGNNNVILDGSTIPSVSNLTDMGIVPIPFPTAKNYTLQNNGTAAVSISSITITGANAGDFVLSGITFPKNISADSSTTFTITCNTTVVGIRSAVVHVNYTECTVIDYDFAIQAAGLIPVLYPYPAASVTAGGSVSVTPTAPAYGIQSLSAIAPAAFLGVISADAATGKINITDARPAGTYTITVYPFTSSTQTFVLTVTNPVCSYSNFTKSEYSAGYGSSSMAVGDFNNDGNQDLVITSDYAGLIMDLGDGLGGFVYGADNYNSGAVSSCVITGDFNNDGYLDLASTVPAASKIYLNFNNGFGTFGAYNVFSAINVGTSPSYLASGDFNGDGKLDLASANSGSNNVSIRLGDGAGGFTNAADVNVGNGPNSIAVGDFNSDGKSDIATANAGSTSVSIRLGNGSGSFSGTTEISLSAVPSYLSLGDFNADGKQDFAVIKNSTNTISVRFGDGLGNFSGTTELNGTYNMYSIAVGDYNGDGKQDLAAASQSTWSVVLFTSNGAGGFNAGVKDSTAYGPTYIVAGDFNKDSIQDLAATNPGVYKISVLTGNTKTIVVTGNGNIINDGSTTISSSINTDYGFIPINNSAAKLFTIKNYGAVPITISSISKTGTNASDFTFTGVSFPLTIQGGDSLILSIACTPTTAGTKSAVIHINHSGCQAGDYDFALEATGINPVLGNYSPLTLTAGRNGSAAPSAAPINAPYLYVSTSPGFKGVLTADPVTGVVRILDARPAGSYTITVKVGTAVKTFVLTVSNPLCSNAAFESYSEVFNYSGNNSLTVADFNKDGIQDLATANNSNLGEITINFGNASGGFDFPGSYTYVYNKNSSLAAGDLNGDGNEDLVTGDYEVNKASVLIGDGFGNFTVYPAVNVGLNPVSIVLADFNSDGKLDLATANYDGNTFSVRLGDGLGHFTGSTEVAVGTNPNFISVGDFNNDGKADIAVSNYTSSTISIRLGNGSGGFTGSTNITVGTNPNCIAIADFNGDGKSDFATSNYIDENNANISICTGNGTGGFTLTSTIAASWPVTPKSIISGDFNGDGKQDLAAASGIFSPDIAIYMGTGTGSFSAGYNLGTLGSAQGVVLGDFNSDGFEDLAVSNTYGISILKGKTHSINVLGNNISITDGSIASSITDNTNFGLVPVSYSTARSFSIRNDGAVSFTVNSITINGVNQSDFSVTGITLPVTISGRSTKTFNVVCNSPSSGFKTAVVHVNYTECAAGDYDFVINANTAIPSLGNYPASTVSSCGNITVLPTSVPVNVERLYVTASPAFSGIIEANPITGVITVTNAKPAGTYSVTVRSGNVTKVFSLTVNPPVCSPGSFSAGQYVAIEYVPRCITLGDYNNDGSQDYLSTGSSTNETATVRFGDGAGGFSGIQGGDTISYNQGIDYLTTADFNGDGKDDIAFSGYGMTTFEVRLGDGMGGFTGTNSFPAGTDPLSLATGDFNNDSKLDIAVSNQGSNTVSIMIGDGTGSFSWSSDIAAANPRKVGVADFNNDGKVDLAIASLGTSTVSIKLGNGLGAFTGSTSVTVGFDPISLETGDFNNDGKQDFITGNLNPPTYSVRLGNGTGGFTGSANPTLPYGPWSIATGDFNGDNFMDFTAATWSQKIVLVRYGNGTGAFTGTTEISDSEFVVNLLVGDFNEDKIEDILTVNSTTDINKGSIIYYGTSNEVNVTSSGNLISDGSNTFSTSNNTDFGTLNSASPVTNIYTIQNIGKLPLTISSITITGSNPGDFSVSGISLPWILGADSLITFNLTFTPQSGGVRSAVIHVNNNDCNEADYDFAVHGTYCLSPAFSVCPGNINSISSPGFCRQAVTYTAAVTGNPAPSLSTVFSGATTGNVSGIGSGSTFNTGTTHVVISAVNLCSTAVCSFDITVTSAIDDNNVCTIDDCNIVTGIISHTSVNTNDNDSCTVDGCNPVTGVFHIPVNVDDNNSCTNDGCLPLSGIFHNPISTDDGNACTDDGCNAISGVFHNPVNTDDLNACTIDACDTFTGISHTPVNSDDNIAFTIDGCDSLTGIFHHPVFYLKMFIEGFYTGNGLMDNFGEGGCLKINNISSVFSDADTVHLEMVDAVSLLPVKTSTALLQTDGTAVFNFDSVFTNDCYLKVNHRNTIETWSASPVSLITTNSYDFTSDDTKAYGSNMSETFDHAGWSFYSGDIADSSNRVGRQDGIIGSNDYSILENAVYFVYAGYIVEDITGDGLVESRDYNLMENNFYYGISLMRP